MDPTIFIGSSSSLETLVFFLRIWTWISPPSPSPSLISVCALLNRRVYRCPRAHAAMSSRATENSNDTHWRLDHFHHLKLVVDMVLRALDVFCGSLLNILIPPPNQAFAFQPAAGCWDTGHRCWRIQVPGDRHRNSSFTAVTFLLIAITAVRTLQRTHYERYAYYT